MVGTGSGTQDYGMRIYNPALGKFLSVDPLQKEFPWNSTYAFAENDVIRNIDLDGEEKLGASKKFAALFGKAIFSVIFKSEVLKNEVYNDIHKAEKSSSVFVVFATFKNDRKQYKANTTDLVAGAHFVKQYESEETHTTKQTESYNVFKSILTESGFTADVIINLAEANKTKILAVSLNEKAFEGLSGDALKKEATKAFTHEVKAHLKNEINNTPESAEKEHMEYFNIDIHNMEDFKLFNQYNLIDGYSIPENAIKEDSPAKKDIKTIDATVDGK